MGGVPTHKVSISRKAKLNKMRSYAKLDKCTISFMLTTTVVAIFTLTTEGMMQQYCNLIVLCCSKCLFSYGPICHGSLKLDLSTLLATIFLWTFLPLIYNIRWGSNNTFSPCPLSWSFVQSHISHVKWRYKIYNKIMASLWWTICCI